MPFRALIVAVLFIVFALLSSPTNASVSGVVISQVYGGGGNNGSTYRQDFIEIFNGGQTTLNISGWSVQTRTVVGAVWNIATLPDTTLSAGQYFLIQVDGATTNYGTVDLPAPDLVSQLPQMSATAGRVALVTNNIAVEGVTDPDVIDFVGYNTPGNSIESETSPVNGMSNVNSIKRLVTGCLDTDNNASDFTASPAYPYARNSQSPLSICNSSGATATATAFTSTPTATPTATSQVNQTQTATADVPPVTATLAVTNSSTTSPTSTPTHTPTLGVGIALLSNGGMEGVPTVDNAPSGWTVKRASKDRQKCNKANKFIAHEGICAFHFKGGSEEKSQLSQNVVLGNFLFQQGDVLRLSFALNAPTSATSGKIKLRIKYGDGTSPRKFDQDFGQTSQYVQTEVFIPVDSANIAKISLKFVHRSAAGKVYVDAVSLAQFKALP